MFSFGRSDVRQFGGVGAMVEQPALQLKIEPAERFEVRGPHAARVRKIADRVLTNVLTELGRNRALDELALAIEIKQAPREHVGLGAGTQLRLPLPRPSWGLSVCRFRKQAIWRDSPAAASVPPSALTDSNTVAYWLKRASASRTRFRP